MSEPKQPWLPVAVLGMLTVQFLVVALLAWRVLVPQTPDDATQSPAASAGAELAAQRAVLDRVIGQLDVAPEGIVQSLEQQRQKNDELQSSNLGLLTHVREVSEAQQKSDEKLQFSLRQNEDLQAANDQLQGDRETARELVQELTKKLAQYEQADSEKKATELLTWLAHWKWYVGSGVIVLLVIAAGVYKGTSRWISQHATAD